MRCFLHHEHDAVAICPACGRGLCAECARPVGLACACEDCVGDVATLAARQPTPQRLTEARITPLCFNFTYLTLGLLFPGWGVLLFLITHDPSWLNCVYMTLAILLMGVTGFVLYGVLRRRQRRRR